MRALSKALSIAAIVPAIAATALVAHADPTTSDCLSASEASLTLRGEHKLRAARAQAATCAWATCPVDVRDECSKRVSQINAAIPTIVFEVKDPAGNDVSAVKVTMDGELLLEKLDGTAISLDPGSHKFAFTTTSGATIEKPLLLHEGEKQRRERIVLAPASVAVPTSTSSVPVSISLPAPTTSSVEPLPAPPPVTPDRAEGGGSGRRTLGLVVGGVGIVGLGLGAGFGLSASSTWSNAKSECNKSTCPSPAQAQSDHDSAVTAATISTVGFVFGGVALATGIVLFITAPKSTGGTSVARSFVVAPAVGPGTGGLVMRGSF